MNANFEKLTMTRHLTCFDQSTMVNLKTGWENEVTMAKHIFFLLHRECGKAHGHLLHVQKNVEFSFTFIPSPWERNAIEKGSIANDYSTVEIGYCHKAICC